MSLQKYVKEVRPRRNLTTKLQFSEAYEIIPKSSGEIDTLDIPHDKESLKGLFDEIVTSSGMACLLYTSPSPRDAKLSRMPSSA